jgi:hypothetical protein
MQYGNQLIELIKSSTLPTCSAKYASEYRQNQSGKICLHDPRFSCLLASGDLMAFNST